MIVANHPGIVCPECQFLVSWENSSPNLEPRVRGLLSPLIECRGRVMEVGSCDCMAGVWCRPTGGSMAFHLSSLMTGNEAETSACSRCGGEAFDYCAACDRDLCPTCLEAGCCGQTPAESGLDSDSGQEPEFA